MIKQISTGLLFSALFLSGCASDAAETNEQTAEQHAETNALIDDLLAAHEENTNYAPGDDQHVAYTQQELVKKIEGDRFKQEALFNRDTYAYELHVSDTMKSKIEQNGLTLEYLFELSFQGRYLSEFVQKTSYDPDLNIAIVDPQDNTRDYLFLIRDGEIVESILDDIEIAD